MCSLETLLVGAEQSVKWKGPSDPEGSHRHCWGGEGHSDRSPSPVVLWVQKTWHPQGATAWWSPDTWRHLWVFLNLEISLPNVWDYSLYKWLYSCYILKPFWLCWVVIVWSICRNKAVSELIASHSLLVLALFYRSCTMSALSALLARPPSLPRLQSFLLCSVRQGAALWRF